MWCEWSTQGRGCDLYNFVPMNYTTSCPWPIQCCDCDKHNAVVGSYTTSHPWPIQHYCSNLYNTMSMTYTTLLQWSIQRHVHDPTQRHVHDPTQRHVHGLINVVDVSYTTSCPWPSLPRIHAQYNVMTVTCITSIYHHLLVRLPPVGLIQYNYFW